MLLRASRAASQLTKQALLGTLGRVGGAGLRFAGRHWKGVGGAGLVGITAAPGIAKSVQQSNVGLSKPYLQAVSAGVAPHVPKF